MGEHGTGSIVPDKRGEDRWIVAATMPSGRRIYRRVVGRKAAEAKLADLLRARRLELEPSAQTLAAWLRSWLLAMRADTAKPRAPRTLDGYDRIIEKSIIPVIGRYRLEQLTGRHALEWWATVSGKPQTRINHYNVLHGALERARRAGVVERNVAEAIDLPARVTFEPNPLTPDEVRRLFAATEGHRLHVLWRLAVETGLREAELLALGRDDVDTAACRVTTGVQLQRIWLGRMDAKGRRVLDWVRRAPKAARTLTVLTISPETAAAIEAHLVRQAAERKPDWAYWGHLFVTVNGKPYHGAEVLKAFKAACRKAGIGERRFHDLRSTTATLMAEAGVDKDVRKARLGHATDAMAAHYRLVREAADQEALSRLAKAIR